MQWNAGGTLTGYGAWLYSINIFIVYKDASVYSEKIIGADMLKTAILTEIHPVNRRIAELKNVTLRIDDVTLYNVAGMPRLRLLVILGDGKAIPIIFDKSGSSSTININIPFAAYVKLMFDKFNMV
jgi:hypothetical protein